MGEINYNKLADRRPDVWEHYIYTGGWPEGTPLPQIYNHWFQHTLTPPDAASYFGSLTAYAQALGAYDNGAPPLPPATVEGVPPSGHTAPPATPAGDVSITKKLWIYVEKEPILAAGLVAAAVLGVKWVIRQ